MWKKYIKIYKREEIAWHDKKFDAKEYFINYSTIKILLEYRILCILFHLCWYLYEIIIIL